MVSKTKPSDREALISVIPSEELLLISIQNATTLQRWPHENAPSMAKSAQPQRDAAGPGFPHAMLESQTAIMANPAEPSEELRAKVALLDRATRANLPARAARVAEAPVGRTTMLATPFVGLLRPTAGAAERLLCGLRITVERSSAGACLHIAEALVAQKGIRLDTDSVRALLGECLREIFAAIAGA